MKSDVAAALQGSSPARTAGMEEVLDEEGDGLRVLKALSERDNLQHDLNNAITVALAFADLALKHLDDSQASDDDPRRQLFQSLARIAEELGRAVRAWPSQSPAPVAGGGSVDQWAAPSQRALKFYQSLLSEALDAAVSGRGLVEVFRESMALDPLLDGYYNSARQGLMNFEQQLSTYLSLPAASGPAAGLEELAVEAIHPDAVKALEGIVKVYVDPELFGVPIPDLRSKFDDLVGDIWKWDLAVIVLPITDLSQADSSALRVYRVVRTESEPTGLTLAVHGLSAGTYLDLERDLLLVVFRVLSQTGPDVAEADEYLQLRLTPEAVRQFLENIFA